MKKLIIIVLILLLAGSVNAGSIFDSEYVKYPREVYMKYCGHHMTPAGFWDCLDALDRNGIPKMGCSNPGYLWVQLPGYKTFLDTPENRAEMIKAWATSGYICEALGHIFGEPWCDQVLTSHPPQYLYKHKCKVCGKVESLIKREVKEEWR